MDKNRGTFKIFCRKLDLLYGPTITINHLVLGAEGLSGFAAGVAAAVEVKF